MPSSPDEMLARMIENMPEKTGKPLPHWLKVVTRSGLEKHGQIVKMLKTDHGLTHGYANCVAMVALRPAEAPADEDLVAAQYAGGKAALRPIHDEIVKAVRGFGNDVGVEACKTYVTLRRSKQFGLVKPSTRTRVDVGIKLKGVKAAGRLEPEKTGGMVTHVVAVTDPSQVDAELIGWLRQAYEAC